MGKQKSSPSHLSRANRLRRLQPSKHQKQQQQLNNSSTPSTTNFSCRSLCTTGTILKIFFLALLVLMNLLSIQYWHQVQAGHEFEQQQQQQSLDTTLENFKNYKDSTKSTTDTGGVTKVRSGKVVIDDSTTITTTGSTSTTNQAEGGTTIDFTFPNSSSRNDQLKCNDYRSYSSNVFLSQKDAKRIVDNYANEIKSKSQRPRFVPVLVELMKFASNSDQMLLTVQLGGMDGRTGDPFYRMTELYRESLKYWLPVVIEPVPMNFEKLIYTYQQHQANRELHCGHLLKQLINYDPKQESPPGKCGFCHFDETSTKCHDIPSWQKYEIGSMECDRKAVADLKDCFTRSEFDCGKIIDGGLSNLNLLASQIVVLQIDVEGFEKQVLEGFFSEIDDPSHYPPVINFENKILLGRKILQPVYDLLRNKGYSLHEKRTDTLCLLDHKGDTFLDKK